jgi:hypothetical protein
MFESTQNIMNQNEKLSIAHNCQDLIVCCSYVGEEVVVGEITLPS